MSILVFADRYGIYEPEDLAFLRGIYDEIVAAPSARSDKAPLPGISICSRVASAIASCFIRQRYVAMTPTSNDDFSAASFSVALVSHFRLFDQGADGGSSHRSLLSAPACSRPG